MENFSGMLLPIGTLVLVVLVQISFWFPTETKQRQTSEEPRPESMTETPPAEQRSQGMGRKPLNGTASIRINTGGFPTGDFRCLVAGNDASYHQENAPKTQIPTTTSELPKNSTSETQTNEGNDKRWKCVCELGILPAGMLRTFGNAEAMMRLGVGQCYHKK